MADQDTSFQAMARLLDAVRRRSSSDDPAVDERDRLHRRRRRRHVNTGRMFVALKPLDERKITADQVIARLRGKLAQHPRRDALPAGRPGPAHRRPGQQRAVSVHAARRQPRRAERLGPEGARSKCASCPASSTSTATSRTAGLQADADHRPRHRRPARHHAAADRQHALRCLRPAAGLDDVHAAEPVSRGDGSRPAVLAEPRRASNTSTSPAATARRCRSSAFAHYDAVDHAAGRQPLRASSRRSRSRSTCCPASRWATRSTEIQTGRARDGPARHHPRQLLRAPPRRSRPRWRNEPLLILAALRHRLHRAGHSLRELHPPDHDPLDAPLGRRRRAAGAAALQART